MLILAGLGNIGAEYEGTRHNIGFRVLYELAEQNNMSFKTGKGPYYLSNGVIEGKKCILVLPTTFMNRSGSAITHAMNYYQVPANDVFVVTDDINLPIGKIRIKPTGSAGGHNGLADIIYQLKSDEFSRLRFGVGNNFSRGEQAKFVLSKFGKDEDASVAETVKRSIEAIRVYLREGITPAMNQFNS